MGFFSFIILIIDLFCFDLLGGLETVLSFLSLMKSVSIEACLRIHDNALR